MKYKYFIGIIEFNKLNIYICCGGSLYLRYVDGFIYKCCRDKVYNGRKSICCNGVYYLDKSLGDKVILI